MATEFHKIIIASLVPTFFILSCVISLHITVAEDIQSSRVDDVEERFLTRIEAPNKLEILENLLKNYDGRLRPHYRERPVEVSLYAVIDSFHDILEEQMEYRVDLVLKESWKDPRLVYGNHTWFVRMKGETMKKLWLPDTLIENSRKHEVEDKTRTALVFGDGTIFYSEWVKATLTSHMEFHKFPMDIQILKLQIAAYSYDDTQVRYHWTKVTLAEKEMTEFYVDKQTLKMEPTSYITGSGTHTAAIVEFTIKRRLEHYIIEFYLPCIACTLASWVQFWMEADDIGSRTGLGITTVLTEIFLLEFSNQGMPKVSYMKSAELFVVVSFTFIFFALVESALVYKANTWSKKQDDRDKSKQGDQSSNNSNLTEGKYYNGLYIPSLIKSSLKGLHDTSPAVHQQNLTIPSESIPTGNKRGNEDPPDATSSASKSLPSGYNWSMLIDKGARIAFPVLYFSFTITYFWLALKK